MNFQQTHFRIKPMEFDLFCGMDVDKKSISITFVSHDGFVRSMKIPYDSANLIQYVRSVSRINVLRLFTKQALPDLDSTMI